MARDMKDFLTCVFVKILLAQEINKNFTESLDIVLLLCRSEILY